jgi:hypothetical protein
MQFGRARLNRVARRGAALVLLTSAMLCGLAAGLSPAASGALPAFDVSPASLSIQAGDMATGTLSNMPVPPGDLGCVEAASGTSIYLSVSFSVPCGAQTGWSSSMTVRTIPATPAGTYTIVFQVCPTPGCSMGPDIRNAQPIETRSWTVVVTGGPVPVETVPFTSPMPTAPAPTSQAPRVAPTPSRSALPTAVPTATSPSGTQPATPTPSLSAPSPAVAAGGVAPGLVLDHPVLKAGQTLRVSGTGCTPDAAATVALPGSVTGTTTAGSDGAFQLSFHVPSSLRAGRYPVVAQCGATLSTLVDVQRPRSLGTAAALGLAAVAILLAGAAAGWMIRGRRRLAQR